VTDCASELVDIVVVQERTGMAGKRFSDTRHSRIIGPDMTRDAAIGRIEIGDDDLSEFDGISPGDSLLSLIAGLGEENCLIFPLNLAPLGEIIFLDGGSDEENKGQKA